MPNPRSLLFVSLLVLYQNAHAQGHFDRISIEQGLSNQAVYALLQDRQGFLWVGTQNGLDRYDGRRFVHYNHVSGDPGSLGDNFIRCLLEDRKGLIWIGHREGISCLDQTTERFENFSLRAFGAGQKKISEVLSLAELPNGSLLVGTSSGLFFFDVPKKAFTRILPQHGAAPGQGLRVNALLPFGETRCWAGTDAGLVRVEAKGPSGYEAKIVLSLPPVQGLCAEGDRGLWLATDAGVCFFDHATGQARPVGKPQQTAFVAKDRRGRLLTGNLRGIEVWDDRRGDFLPLLKDDSKGGWFKASRPQAILEDRNQTFWIATFSDGLYHYNPYRQRFRIFRHEEDNPHSLSDNFTIALLEDSQGALWIGTDADLNRLDPLTGRFSTFATKPTGMVRAVFEDREGTLWAGIPTGVIQQKKGAPPRNLTYNPAQRDCPGRAVKAIFQDHAGVLWFGGGNGLFRRQAPADVFEPVELPGLQADTNMIYHITEDHQYNLWVSTSNGLLRVGKNRRDFRLFTHDPARPQSLCDNNISSVAVGRDGQTWVASYDGGLEKYEAATETFRHFTQKNGLPDEKIWGIVEDNRGFLWLSHCRGLSRFDPRTETFRHFDKADGLQDHEFVIGSFHKGKNSGKLYFGGAQGFNAFHPDSLPFNETPPAVVFTAFRFHRGGVEASAFGQINGISGLSAVALDYPVQTIVCEFAALDYRMPEKNRYAYRIDGIHGDWVDLGNKAEVTFANLPPGSYTLRVRAANNDGVWNDAGAALRITLHPPWWATWWAYALYALCLGAAIWALYQNQLRRRLAAAEAMRLRELDQFKSRFFTNITHEFRTPLTVILGTSEQLAVGGGQSAEHQGEVEIRFPKSKFQQQIGLIKRNGENLLRLINQILDLAKLENNILQINYMQGDVLAYLNYIVESLRSWGNAQNVALHLESDEKEIIMDYDPERLLQIVHNLLSNAIKFTPGGGNVTLSVALQPPPTNTLSPLIQGEFIMHHSSFIIIQVSDTGAGIDPVELPHIFDRFYQARNQGKASAGGTGIGLALTKELVKALRGDIAVTSEVGKGSIFTVRLPVTREAALADAPAPALSPAQPQAFSPVLTDAIDPAGERPLLLLVEDNADVVAFLADCLRDRYQLALAYNGQAGIEKALELVPDLIVSDVMMPEKDGLELCDILKNDERTSHIPIVLLTAKASVESRIAGLRRGADAYLAKPVHQEELTLVLDNLLALRRKYQEKYSRIELQSGAAENSATAPDAAEDAFMQKARDVVEAKMSSPNFGAEDLCRALAMSQSQLHRKLTALTGKNITQFIRAIRLGKARQLLLAREMNVGEAALAVGFEDPKYFSRVFSEVFGVAPSKV